MPMALAHLSPHPNSALSLLHPTTSSGRRNTPSSRAVMAAASSELLQAAKHTMENYVSSGMVIGLGSGPASSFAIQHLGRRLRVGSLGNIVGIPGSVASASEAAKAGIPLQNYQDGLHIDLAFADADLVEEETLASVFGRRKFEGDDSIIQEKSVMRGAANLVVMVDEKHYTKEPDGSIPVLVKTGNWLETAEAIDDLFLGDAEVWRRPTYGHADPLGGNFPLVTSEGHHVLDVIFTSPILDLAQVRKSLDEIDGVVEHGVISGVPCTTIVASRTGVLMVDNLSRLQS